MQVKHIKIHPVASWLTFKGGLSNVPKSLFLADDELIFSSSSAVCCGSGMISITWISNCFIPCSQFQWCSIIFLQKTAYTQFTVNKTYSLQALFSITQYTMAVQRKKWKIKNSQHLFSNCNNYLTKEEKGRNSLISYKLYRLCLHPFCDLLLLLSFYKHSLIFSWTWHPFYCAMLCIRGTSHGHVSVCLCLSQAGVLLKQQNVGSHNNTTRYPSDSSFLMPKIAKFDRMQVGWSKSATFDK